MRQQFCDALVRRSRGRSLVFLSGDLGFMALEPLREALGERFINAGVAEQNMVSVAAAMAREGLETWVYSIAPFCYARPFEQIRNDICFHGLPVKLVGNGGGYGYGVMGPTHHAIEDYGVLLTLPGMSAYIPAFDEDLTAVIERIGLDTRPSYLRLGRGEVPKGFAVPEYRPWRQLTVGRGMTVLSVGPLAGSYIGEFLHLPDASRPNLWVLSELPLERNAVPAEVLRQITDGPGLCVVEEHVQQGSFGSQLAVFLLQGGIHPAKFCHLRAQAHSFGTYGSQNFMRRASGLDVASVRRSLGI